MVSQKCQYALRAVFELAKRQGNGPVRIGDIAKAQAIPPRFLEVILSQLKQAGFVESRRGNEGGYLLTRSPQKLTVGEIIRFIEGQDEPVACTPGAGPGLCKVHENCVFLAMWKKVGKAVDEIYDQTTFQTLIDEESRMCASAAPSFSI